MNNVCSLSLLTVLCNNAAFTRHWNKTKWWFRKDADFKNENKKKPGFAKKNLNLLMFYDNEQKFIPILFDSLTRWWFYYMNLINAVFQPTLGSKSRTPCRLHRTSKCRISTKLNYIYIFFTLDWFRRSARTGGNQMEKGRKTDTALQHVIFCQPAAHTPNLTLWHSESSDHR